jgi:hypothetical protein
VPKTADSTRSEFSAGMNENHVKSLLLVGAFKSSTTWRCIPRLFLHERLN